MDQGFRSYTQRLVFMALQGLTNLGYVSTMNTHGLMQLLASNMKLLCPIMNVGSKFRIDLVRIVRSLGFRDFSFLGNFL
jgi:hypothetical protein